MGVRKGRPGAGMECGSERDNRKGRCLRASLPGPLDHVPAHMLKPPPCLPLPCCARLPVSLQAIQAHRVGHWMWQRGRKSLAVALQSRMSEVFGVDIHPAATLGWGVMMDHATGGCLAGAAECRRTGCCSWPQPENHSPIETRATCRCLLFLLCCSEVACPSHPLLFPCHVQAL